MPGFDTLTVKILADSQGVSQSITVWISLSIAFAAIIIAPTIQLKVGKMQVSSTVKSANRQGWINSMRGFLAEFLAISVWLFATRRDQNPDMLEPRRERRERARELQFSIDLALNPVESEHLKLSALILELIHMNLAKPDDYEFSALNGKRQAIVDVARAIFKTEWERVKKLE